VKKWTSEVNRPFPNKEVKMASKFMKKCSTSRAVKEMQIQKMLRFHLAPVRMATKNTDNTNVDKNAGEREPSYFMGGNAS
jgi:hypothetical protein